MINVENGKKKAYNLFGDFMNIYVPDYFRKFRCTADKCPDTCCAGWEVYLDPEATEKYRKTGGGTGEKLKKVMTKDEDGDDIFTLTDCGRCPFLNDSNLCELIINLGEESISKTCEMFPRYYEDYGDFREMGLGMGCPEAARIILENDEPLDFVKFGRTDNTSEPVDGEFLEMLIGLRNMIFDILEDEEESFRNKIRNILETVQDIQDEFDRDIFKEEPVPRPGKGTDFQTCIDVLSGMEYIDEKRKNTLLSLDPKTPCRKIYKEYQKDFVKLMQYYVHRYLLQAVFDYDILIKVKYGVFACAVIGRLYTAEPDRVKAMYGYSKEVEYSDVNMDILDDALFYDFGTESLISLF